MIIIARNIFNYNIKRIAYNHGYGNMIRGGNFEGDTNWKK